MELHVARSVGVSGHITNQADARIPNRVRHFIVGAEHPHIDPLALDEVSLQLHELFPGGLIAPVDDEGISPRFIALARNADRVDDLLFVVVQRYIGAIVSRFARVL